MEIWKTIKDYPNYQVSNLGNVKSLNYNKTKKEKLLSKCVNSNGYETVNLYKNGQFKNTKVHKLVAQEFLNHKPCGYKLVVNHINFIKTDNRVENLEIVTARENSNQKHLKSTSDFVGVSWLKSRNKWRSVIRINKKTKHLGLFDTELKASEYYQIALKNHLKNNQYEN
jgi:hypothetical protein